MIKACKRQVQRVVLIQSEECFEHVVAHQIVSVTSFDLHPSLEFLDDSLQILHINTHSKRSEGRSIYHDGDLQQVYVASATDAPYIVVPPLRHLNRDTATFICQ